MTSLSENVDIYLKVTSHKDADTGCILWTGNTHSRGYGRVTWDWEKMTGHQFAHRLAYAHYIGGIWPKHVVIHRCRNRLCINPVHLEQVADHESIKYRVFKDEILRGSQVKSHRLVERDIPRIRFLKGIKPGRLVAEQFGVSKATISAIWRREAWKHV